jgi:hypothetical protein
VPEEIQVVESDTAPICPHCEAALTTIEYRQEWVKKTEGFLFLKAKAWIILFACPQCHKLLNAHFGA